MLYTLQTNNTIAGTIPREWKQAPTVSTSSIAIGNKGNYEGFDDTSYYALGLDLDLSINRIQGSIPENWTLASTLSHLNM